MIAWWTNFLMLGSSPRRPFIIGICLLSLQEQGGWPSRESINWFGEYAAVVFDKLADRVNLWATHNEPWVAAFLGYGTGIHAPGINDATQAFQAAHHLLLAHAKAVDIFRSGNYGGEIGLILNLNHLIPGSDREEDIQATQRVYDETHSLFLDPIFLGKYPEKFLEVAGTKPAQNRKWRPRTLERQGGLPWYKPLQL